MAEFSESPHRDLKTFKFTPDSFACGTRLDRLPNTVNHRHCRLAQCQRRVVEGTWSLPMGLTQPPALPEACGYSKPAGKPMRARSSRAVPTRPIMQGMSDALPTQSHSPRHVIELKLRDLGQLFNTMDPSPFHEKDLDADAEEFMVSWMRELPLEEDVVLVVHLSQFPARDDPQAVIEGAIRHYFGYRARLNQLEFRRLMKDGRTSLLIGLCFLAVCLSAAQSLGQHGPETLLNVLREGLTIAGWVAMWRPMEIFLYEWWPVRRRGRVYEKMSRMKVEVRKLGD